MRVCNDEPPELRIREINSSPDRLEIGFHGLVGISQENAGIVGDNGSNVRIGEPVLFEEMPD